MSPSNEHPHIPFALIEWIAEIVDVEEKQITNRQLLALCNRAGIDGLASDPHLCHEIAETALNYFVKTKYGEQLLISNNPSDACSDILKPLQKRLPSQTWRSSTQITYQQFSTPASIAYLAAYLLNLNSTDIVLEPSCGTGSLAVWALAAGATVVTNEIDKRRCDLSRLLAFEPTDYDAEFIDDLLPESIAPNVILANPTFSSSGGRVTRNQRKFGFRHVESALRRLVKGGRFAIILGESGSLRTVSGKRFWESLLPGIRVTAAIELPGSEYYRNGTTVGVTLILGRKPCGFEPGSPASIDHINIAAASVEDAFGQALTLGLRFNPTTE